jgi:hypothetical protein
MRKLAVISSLLFFIFNLQAQDLSLKASTNMTTVGVSGNFTYELEISGPVKSLPEPDLPNFSDFEILSGPNVSTSFQIVNFDMSASKTYSFILSPLKIGEFVIPAATVESNGKKYQSNSIKITVTQNSQSPPSQSQKNRRGSQNQNIDLGNSLFLKAVPSKTSVYVNEQVNVSYKIYFRVNIRNPEYIKLPETIGFWVEEYPIKGDIPISQETLNGIQYNVAEIKKLALFPSKSGELKVTPLQLRINVQTQQQRREPFDVFDSFFDNPFGRMISKELVSNEISIKVKPLPPNAPDKFSGLVGDFRLMADLDKTNVPSNEAISLKLNITGTGNLKVLNEIPIEVPSNFELFEPKIKDNVNRDGIYLSESKEFEYIMIPRVSGEYKIAPVKVPYFDPFQKQYKTLTSGSYNIHVTKGKELAGNLATSYLSKEDVKLLAKDIHFIMEKKPDFVPIDYAPYNTIWFLLSMLLPAIAVVGAYGYRNHLEKVSTNLEYARKRKAHKQARKQLTEAFAFLKNNQLSEFYGEISRALLGYVADKTNKSAAGMIREDVEEIFKLKQVNTEIVQQYFKCLDDADFRRFAPSQNSKEETHSFYKQAEKILVRLEKYL